MRHRRIDFLCAVPLCLAACLGDVASAGPTLSESRKSDATGEEQARVILETCVRSLQIVRDKTEQWILKHPTKLVHLGKGVLDEEALSLHFPERKERMKSRKALDRRRNPLIPWRGGIHLQLFRQPRATETKPKTQPRPQTFYWPFLDVRFEWSWAWPNGEFDQKVGEEFYDILRQALRPLIDLERSTCADMLHGRGKESFVPHGKPGFEIKLRPDENLAYDESYAVGVFVQNTTSGVLAFVPNAVAAVILDRVAEPDRMLDQIGRPQRRVERWPGSSDPFIYLQPNEIRQLGSIGFGHLKPGVHAVRIVKHYLENGWTDIRPTYHDGRPEYRRVTLAWTGVVISNEVTVVVPSGPTTPTAHPTP